MHAGDVQIEADGKADDGTETEQESGFTRFVYRNNWFVLSPTEGAEYKPEPLPEWDETPGFGIAGH